MSVGLAACSSFGKLVDPPHVELESINVREATELFVLLDFGLRVQNPNRMAIQVDRIVYDLEINGRPLTREQVVRGTTIAAMGTGIVIIPIQLKYEDIFRSVAALFQNGAIGYRLKGVAEMGLVKIPFDKTGDFKLDTGKSTKIH